MAWSQWVVSQLRVRKFVCVCVCELVRDKFSMCMRSNSLQDSRNLRTVYSVGSVSPGVGF